MKSFVLGACVCTLLAGCGGSTMTVTTSNDPVIPDSLPEAAPYRALANAGMVQGAAVALGRVTVLERVGDSNLFEEARAATGKFDGVYNYETQEFVFLAAGLTLVKESDGRGIEGRTISGNRHVVALTQFLELPAGADRTSDERVSSVLIAGIPTLAEDIPGAGMATLRGFSRYGLDGGMSLSADAVMTVDFGRQRVDVLMTSLTTEDVFATRVALDDMVMSGSGFQGGRMTLMNDGSVVAPLGLSPVLDARGQFFGPISAGAGPDEAGGYFVAAGNGATVSGEFLVD